jgi:5-(carboxyamino)imidazole ribonucleotide synthase
VLKTASSGYDGKGQAKIAAESDLASVWNELSTDEAIYEAFINFEREVSVIGVRGVDGSTAFYGPIENEHSQHILDVSRCPADVPAPVKRDAIEIARAVLETLDVVGVLCVELFLKDDGTLLINELAPRPHNSGHLTIEAFATSQFEQQVRAVAGLPLGAAEQLRPAAMANLLGDAWQPDEPQWDRALAVAGVSLHLYGKAEAKPGRKMGHLTATAATTEEAVQRVIAARESLQGDR